MKTIAVMQPTYLPWIGYFDLMDQVDAFVFLDSVQFEKRSWQQRNRIKTAKGELMLTIPVLSKGKFEQKISQVLIDQSSNFSKDHLKAIEYSYSQAEYFTKYFPSLKKIINQDYRYLVALNIKLIKWLKNVLGIKTRLIRSSSLKVSGQKAKLLVNICQSLKADTYLSPLGSKAYIQDGKLFGDNKIKLIYHHFKHPRYQQLYGKFTPFLSTIDLLFNYGPQSIKIIRSGRKK